jgi:hypothetical protein
VLQEEKEDLSMSHILTLRGKTSHAGTPLVHEGSEDVVLATVFGIVKNLSYATVLNPWLGCVTGGAMPESDDWHLSFWEAQHLPAGLDEGSTKVDLEIDSEPALVFAEVKLDAPPSAGTTHDPNRNQLVRNLGDHLRLQGSVRTVLSEGVPVCV